MKLSFYLLLTIIILNTSISAQNNYKITGTIHGYSSGLAKLIGVAGDQNYLADSCFVNAKGEFLFQKSEKFKEGFYYLILPDYKNLQLLIDDQQNITFESNKDNLIKSMRFQNSLTNNLLYDGLRIQSSIDSLMNVQKTMENKDTNKEYFSKSLDILIQKRNDHLKDVQQKYPNNFYTKFKSAGQNPTPKDIRKPNGDLDTLGQLQVYRKEFWDNVDFNDERLLYTPVISNKLKKFITEFTPQVPDSIIRQADFIIQKSMVNNQMFQFISNWIALNYQPTKTTVMDGEAVYVHIIDTYFTEKNASWFKEGELEKLKKKTGEMRASLMNKKGPDVISTDPNGQKKSIYQITEPYIIVYMYTPSCEHCQKETPKLKAFYDEWKNKGVEVFAIVLDTNESEWKNYLKKVKINDWINVYDPTNASIYGKYYVDITPEIYVLNKDRIIIGKNLKVEQIATIINKDLAKQK